MRKTRGASTRYGNRVNCACTARLSRKPASAFRCSPCAAILTLNSTITGRSRLPNARGVPSAFRSPARCFRKSRRRRCPSDSSHPVHFNRLLSLDLDGQDRLCDGGSLVGGTAKRVARGQANVERVGRGWRQMANRGPRRVASRALASIQGSRTSRCRSNQGGASCMPA